VPEEVNQLHQDLEGVDEHRPNLQQEVGGLDVRNLFNSNTQETRTSLNRRKVKTIKSDEYFIFFFLAWLSKYLQFFKAIYLGLQSSD
jgi:hypothetical protein